MVIPDPITGESDNRDFSAHGLTLDDTPMEEPCEMCWGSGKVFVRCRDYPLNMQEVECPVCLRKKFDEQEALLKEVKDSWSEAACDITDLQHTIETHLGDLPPIIGDNTFNPTLNQRHSLVLIRRAKLTIESQAVAIENLKRRN
jgi:hypothetical protein